MKTKPKRLLSCLFVVYRKNQIIIFKQKHMPGQYGNERVTVQNLEIVRVDAARNALLIKGAIPGAKGSVVTVSDSVKAK